MQHREVTGPLTQGSWCMRTSCVAPSTWRPARKRSRCWPPESWRSSASPGDRPVTEPSSPAMSPSRRTRGAESAHNTGGGVRSYTRSCVTGGRSRPGIPPSPRPGRTERRFSSRPCVIGQVDPEKHRVVAPGEEPDAPLGQSAIHNGYPFSRAWGEGWDTGSSTRSDSHPHPTPRSGRLSTGRLA